MRYFMKLIRRETLFIGMISIFCWGSNAQAALIPSEPEWWPEYCKGKNLIPPTDFFDIAQSMASTIDITHIFRRHTPPQPNRSFFYTTDRGQLATLLLAIVSHPTYYDFSYDSDAEKTRLLIVKDFLSGEVSKFSPNEHFIGGHRFLGNRVIDSNRAYLFLDIEDVIKAGKPWDGSKVKLITAYPGDPTYPRRS